ncbi:hypothetical protein C1H46_045047 [Malus baccata]|uniref:40S ribosomal protein S8 n=1 Tax=Malus baccata TaxID=106549 RepID=A0A540K5A6_MALBA|nr:hypothetical protein C1H46_045047 [Malus baccata]
MHKRRATGGKKKAWRKKRKYELGRQPANTKLSSNKTVRRIRVRGGNVKWRALRLDTGNFSWGSEAVTRKTRLLDVVYNASNNELVRTQTLVKSAIVQVDAAPFKQWYLQHYGVEIGRKKKTAAAAKKEAEIYLGGQRAGVLHEEAPEEEGEGSCSLNFGYQNSVIVDSEYVICFVVSYCVRDCTLFQFEVATGFTPNNVFLVECSISNSIFAIVNAYFLDVEQ